MPAKSAIIILGPPGSGKGTQAKRIADYFDYVYFGTGEMIRQEIKMATSFGQVFKEVAERDKSALFPDELINQFVEEKIKGLPPAKGIVFDGYPRTLAQIDEFEEILKRQKITGVRVLNLVVSEGEVIKRMETRRVCEHCDKVFENPGGVTTCDACGGALTTRYDDQPEVLKKRIQVYNQLTDPLINYYKEKGVLTDIDGEPSIDEVWNDIKERINNVH